MCCCFTCHRYLVTSFPPLPPSPSLVHPFSPSARFLLLLFFSLSLIQLLFLASVPSSCSFLKTASLLRSPFPSFLFLFLHSFICFCSLSHCFISFSLLIAAVPHSFIPPLPFSFSFFSPVLASICVSLSSLISFFLLHPSNFLLPSYSSPGFLPGFLYLLFTFPPLSSFPFLLFPSSSCPSLLHSPSYSSPHAPSHSPSFPSFLL